MALRVRRINNFLELWCLVASGGLDIWVSSTSFQKSNIGWPHQPSKEKFLKINMIFHHSTKKTFFQNINLQFFTDISTFSVGGCWGQPMLLFCKLVDETQMSNPPEATIIQENYWSFYPSEPFRITHFKMRHPVCTYFYTKIVVS